MKVYEKYEQSVLMYIFNLISDISLFESIQTQYFYNQDVKNKIEGLYQYIYWNLIVYGESKNEKDNEIFKNVELNSKEIDWKIRKYPLEMENGNV